MTRKQALHSAIEALSANPGHSEAVQTLKGIQQAVVCADNSKAVGRKLGADSSSNVSGHSSNECNFFVFLFHK